MMLDKVLRVGRGRYFTHAYIHIRTIDSSLADKHIPLLLVKSLLNEIANFVGAILRSRVGRFFLGRIVWTRQSRRDILSCRF